jgi:hypothetical protein
MAYGTRSLRKVQISNPENTPGTAEAATEILYFENWDVHETSVEFYMPMADRNSLFKNIEQPFAVKYLAEMEGDGSLYDRLANFLFSASIRGNITPAAVGGLETLAYTWTYAPGGTTQNTPDIANGIDTFTIEDGDNLQGYEQEFCYVTELEISGAINEDVKFKVSMNGRQVTNTTVTAALTDPAAKYFAVNQAKLFIDTSWAGLGGTQKVGVLTAFNWKFVTGFSPRYTADGNLYYTALNEDAKEVELELTFWRDGAILPAELVKFKAQTLEFIRIALFSQGEIDSGQANPAYIYLDGAYRISEWNALEDEDGSSTITLVYKSFKDPTSGSMMQTIVKTAMASFVA